jgi:hypothetical protein
MLELRLELPPLRGLLSPSAYFPGSLIQIVISKYVHVYTLSAKVLYSGVVCVILNRSKPVNLDYDVKVQLTP